MDVNGLVQEICRQNPGVPEAQVRARVVQLLRQQAGGMNPAMDREYPASFRSLLDERAGAVSAAPAAGGPCPGDATLRMLCHCGQCSFNVRVKGSGGRPPPAVRCYCRGCRRFHASAFGAFVAAVEADAPKDWTFGGKALLQRDVCARLGEVDRVVCAKCFTKLATLPFDEEGREAAGGSALLALGSVEDSSVPEPLAKQWQVRYDEWEAATGSAWWAAKVAPRQARPRTVEASGGCACGACSFTAAIFPGEAQHCYCNLCRRLSGAASMTWIPCSNEDFVWTKSEALQLVRTTRHGQRHVCTRCGGVMTIVYDSQPDCTWPVAGALDDESLPKDLSQSWYRVIHICCSMMQPWYRLPDDSLPRLKYAG